MHTHNKDQRFFVITYSLILSKKDPNYEVPRGIADGGLQIAELQSLYWRNIEIPQYVEIPRNSFLYLLSSPVTTTCTLVNVALSL